MTINNVPNQNIDIAYWQNKGIELVDLSKIDETMQNNAKCDNLNQEEGKLLYSFLKYIKDEKIPYSHDDTSYVKTQLLKKIESVKMFKYIGYSTFLKICSFSNPVHRMGEIVNIHDYKEYKLFESILNGTDEFSKLIRLFFTCLNICCIECIDQKGKLFYYDIPEEYQEDDELFILSLKNQYKEIIKKLESSTNNIEKAYYSLIYMTRGGKSQEALDEVEKEINLLDYQQLSDADKYIIALFECNSLLLMQLNLVQTSKERWDDFTELLDNVSAQNNAFRQIKELFEDDGKIINELNGYLVKHEEYYMKKSTLTKLRGTIYGELFNLRYIVYDYYLFYKKNYIMLDWFNNAEKSANLMLKLYYVLIIQMNISIQKIEFLEEHTLNHIH